MNLPSVCRNLDYFVDPLSDESIELGTREFPYRSMRSVISEIVNFFSHTDANITIYTKSGYFEDDIARFLNITSVGFKSHPDLIENGKRAILIPTKIPQVSIFEKSLFHLLNHTNVNILQAIMVGSFTDKELFLLSRDLISLFYVRTNIVMENINVYREESEPQSSQYFLVAVNLQNRLAK